MPSDFFEYFPAAPKERRWGVTSTACGCAVVSPGSPYPSVKHPEAHHFQWDQGRVLHDYQILYIHQGRGRFESARSRPVTVEAGMAFLLFPGIRHRYRPDPETGWTESWIEWQGSVTEGLLKNRVIHPGHPVYRTGSSHEVGALYEAASHLARLKPPGFSVRLGLIALQILTLAVSGKNRPNQAPPPRIDLIISEAQTLMARQTDGTLPPEAVAQRLGIGYSYFRRMFKHQTGFSPKQYQAEIRLRRAQELLQNTDLTMQEIAGQLGYYSPYHFSLDFSRRTGVPPGRWRHGGRD